MAPGRNLSNKTVAIGLGLFLLLGLGLRIGWNVDSSYDEDSGRYLYSGNDPYYHDRAVNHILETGESLVFDEGINYPTGAYNPNPPLYDWTTAIVAKVAEMGGSGDPAGVSLNVMVAVWGALTVIPVFMIASQLFGRTAGLWSAFMISVSAPHIQRGVFGFADHDATTMFFITLSIAFLMRALKAVDDREYVKDWRNPSALKEGLQNSLSHNKTAFLWAALSGVALTATALTWKGYPYVLAVMAVAIGFQLLNDHVRNKDSTAKFILYLIPLLMVTVVPMIYYASFPAFLDTTIWAGTYVLMGVLVVGAILVPTRDLPSILVFPALALAGIIGLALMLWVFPDVGRTVFTGLGYFEQTKLYTTIAEAQRSELGRVAASFGFFTFLLAFAALFTRTFKSAWKGDAPQQLMLAWSLVAIFMAFAASRFIMNAAPVFAILASPLIVSIIAKLDLGQVRKRFRQQHGQNTFKAAMRSLSGRSVGGAALVAAFLILPNLWLGVDAAMPRDYELEKGLVDNNPETVDRFGAYGIDFDIKDNGWGEAFAFLATQDTHLKFEDRPAFIAWWDYGHWATDIGQHPTVADPFQNHFNLAGRVLAAESEQEAQAWMTLLLVNNDYHDGGYEPGTIGALSSYGDDLLKLGPMRGYDAEMELLAANVDMTGNDIFDLYESVSSATGDHIGYFGVDVRMYPSDASSNPGIFYAPAFLANKNPDDFLAYQYVGQGITLDVQQYGVDANGDSYRLAESKIVSSSGASYVVQPTGPGTGVAYPGKTLPIGGPSPDVQGENVQLRLNPTQAFYDSMYAKAFGHGRNGFVPGDGLSHWREVVTGADGAVKILQYFSGVTVTGQVEDDAGNPMPGVSVSFSDGAGASHHAATTDGDGMFEVLAPFSVDGDLNLTVSNGATELYRTNMYQFTQEQANNGHSVSGVDIVVERGDVMGTVYEDLDGDGQFGVNDTAISGVSVTVNGMSTTTGADGGYTFSDVTPGSLSLSFSKQGWATASRTVQVGSGQTATSDVFLAPATSAVTIHLNDANGNADLIPITVTGGPSDRQATTNGDGDASFTLAPGAYTATVDYTITENGNQVQYTLDRDFTVTFGGQDQSFSFTLNTS